MDSRSVAFLSCAALAGAAALYKAAALRREPRNPALWALTASIAFPGAGFAIAAPALYVRVDQHLHRPNIASLLIYGCILAYTATTLIMLLLWSLPAAQARRRAAAILVAFALLLTAMTTLFLLGHVPVEHPDDFDETYGGTPLIGSFLLVYITAFGVGLAAVARRSWHFARRTAQAGPPRRWLRRGLHLVAAGSLICLGYSVGKSVFVLGRWLGADPLPFSKGAVGCAVLAAYVITAGFTMPSWGPRASRLRHWLALARTYLRLYPLWRVIYRALPDVALQPVRWRGGDLWRLHDLRFQLYRRVVEIADGRAALAAYAAPPRAGLAGIAERAGLPVEAVAEAALIREAVTAVRAGARPRGTTGTARPFGPADLEDQLTWLVPVARALRHLPAPSAPATAVVAEGA